MPVIESVKDADALTLTIITEHAATPDRVWQLWQDPRQLERWWGPPTWPATFTSYDFRTGGQARYHMTGPNGDQPQGWWRIVEVSPTTGLIVEDGFCNDSGEPADPEDYSTMAVTLAAIEGGTRMSIVNTFRTSEQLGQLLDMGMEEGMKEALGQIDALLVG